MKLPFTLSLKSIPSFAKKYIQFVLWAFLAITIIAEFFVIKDSVNLILVANNPTPGAQAQLVRVNFEAYKKIEKRIDDSTKFNPEPVKYINPFGQAPASIK